jgi:hypothetical protein
MTHPLTLWRAAAFAEPPQRVHDNSHQAAIGVDLANQLVRYIDGSAGHFPVHDALLAFDRACRRRHAHWPDHRGRPVCSEMVRLIIFGGASVLYCSEQLEMSYPRAERLLAGAVEFMRRKQEAWLAGTEASATHDREMCAVCRSEAV